MSDNKYFKRPYKPLNATIVFETYLRDSTFGKSEVVLDSENELSHSFQSTYIIAFEKYRLFLVDNKVPGM